MDESLLNNILDRLEHARTKHPDGPNMLDLLDEVSEARFAEKNQGKAHYVSELLDVIAVAVRLIQAQSLKNG